MNQSFGQTKPFGALERSLAWRYIRAKREHGGASLISVISFLGIMLAVTALIVTMSVMNGFRAQLTNTLVGGQGHVFVNVNELSEDAALALAGEIEGLPDIAVVSPLIEGQTFATGRRGSSGALVRGVRPEDLRIYPGLTPPRPDLPYGEGKLGGSVIYMGIALANAVGVIPGDSVELVSPSGVKTPFGQTGFRSASFQVGGYIQTGNIELDKAYIFMPLERAQAFYGQKGQFQYLDVRLDNYIKTDQARARINDLTGNRYALQDWKDRNGAYLSALETESGVMRLIMLVLITITSLNIITGVVMLVKNKAGDIAILRTIGATRGSMMRVFIMIGGMLGLVGALIGLALGLTVVLNIGVVEAVLNWVSPSPYGVFPQEIYVFDRIPAKLDLWEAVGTTGWAMVMSMLVTIWPAWLAAKTDPIEALRFE